jgi:hypothetical protein
MYPSMKAHAHSCSKIFKSIVVEAHLHKEDIREKAHVSCSKILKSIVVEAHLHKEDIREKAHVSDAFPALSALACESPFFDTRKSQKSKKHLLSLLV